MPPEVKQVGSQLRQLWQGLSTVRRVLLVTVLAGTALGLGWMARPPAVDYAVLYSGLSVEDSARVTAALTAAKASFRLQAGGTTVEVPRERVDELRVSLAGQGLPQGGGLGFELFDRQNLSTTSFVEKMNYHRALAGELGRTLSAIDGVRNARVHIALPERSLYRKEDALPSVSVALRLEPGRQLSSGQVRGLVHLVTSSMAKLSPDRVSVVDEAGNTLWSGGEEEGASSAQREIEVSLQKRVSELLERLLGPDQSVVVVTADMDTARQERTEEVYGKEGALRSESRSEERRFASQAQAAAVTGVAANLIEPAAPAPAPAPDASPVEPRSSRSTETRNFEVNRVVTRTESPRARLRRLHIAVLINAMPPSSSSTVAGALVVPSEGAILGPRPEDLERIAALVREAAGLDPSRGDRLELQSLPFAAPEPSGLGAAGGTETAAEVSTLPSAYWAAGGGVVAALFLATTWLLVRRRTAAEPLVEVSTPITAAELEARLADNPSYKLSAADLRELSLRERVQLAAKQDAAAAARILSSWVKEKDSARMGGQ